MKIAALTMVFNERHFLPIWLHHYGRQFGLNNLYVVDDGSDDGSTSRLGPVNVLRAPKSVLDEDQRAKKISAIQAELLTRYDAVIFGDVDELVFLDPLFGPSLGEYIASGVAGVASVVGMHVIYSPFTETALQPGVPLFRQRRYMQFDPTYSKPLVGKQPIAYLAGFHAEATASFVMHRPLMMAHLRAADPDIALDRLRSFNRVVVSDANRAQRYSTQFGATAQQYLDQFFITVRQTFTAAVPPDRFDEELLRMLGRWVEHKDLQLGAPLLTLPDRFAGVITLPPLPGA